MAAKGLDEIGDEMSKDAAGVHVTQFSTSEQNEQGKVSYFQF